MSTTIDILIYTKDCVSCGAKKDFIPILAYCNKHNLTYQIRQTSLWSPWRAEAESFEMPLPFVLSQITNRIYSVDEVISNLKLLDNLPA